MTTTPTKVLCVVDYYLPGFMGGGPIRTIANMRRLLAQDVNIAIFTRDRDLGAHKQYDEIQSDTWTETKDGPVYYASPALFGVEGLKQATAGRHFHILYLNSFFGFRSSIQIYLWARRAHPNLPILLAPRGEFSPGALAIKKFKKRVFLTFTRTLRLYRDIQWHASTAAEKNDILRQFPATKDKVHLAADPVEVDFLGADNVNSPAFPMRSLRLVFISRISPMKNLDGLLRILANASHQLELDVYGPIEDKPYWETCQSLIAKLPPNIAVSYKGSLVSEKVSAVFANYDLFAFPTHGENFGHVIFESLRAGTPVLVSDQTPWQTDASGAVTAIPLDDSAAWRAHLQAASDLTPQQKAHLRSAARTYAEEYICHGDVAETNRAMFIAIADRH